jgi:hypothetical protein
LIPDYEQKILFTSFVRSFKINLQIVENDFGEKRLVSLRCSYPGEKKRFNRLFKHARRKKKERKKERKEDRKKAII